MIGGWLSFGILILLLAVGAGIIATGIVRSLHRLHRHHRNGDSHLQMGALLWPGSWMVVKSRDSRAVQAALNVRNPRPCSWLEGFANTDQLFIAPPVKGWILVTGSGLPEPGADVDACFRFLLNLSRKLGRVQFFSANRASHHHAWVQARNGRIVRAYAWADGTIWNQGKTTPAEAVLDLKCFDYLEEVPADAAGLQGGAADNVRKVPLLAARWGLDLARVQEHFWMEEYGLAGKAAYRLR